MSMLFAINRSFSPLHTGLCLLILALSGIQSRASDAQVDGVSYYRQILPIFQAHCHGCHQPAKARGDYVMTGHTALLTPGESGELPIVAGDTTSGLLLQLIQPQGGKAEMPRGKDPLHEQEIALISQWILEGALDDTPIHARPSYDASSPPVYFRPPVIPSLDWSADGQWLAVAGHHEVLLHRADAGGLEARLIGLSERIQSVRFSPDGSLLAVAGGQPGRLGEIQVWDVGRRSLKFSIPVGYDTTYGVAWSPDGTTLSFGLPDRTVRAVDAQTGRQVLQQMAHEDWVLATVFSLDGSHVISAGRDRTAKLTEVATQRFVDNLTSITPGALRGGLQSIARHPSRDEVLVGGADGVPQVYQVFRQAARKIGDNATLLRRFPAVEGRIFSVAYRPDGHQIAVASSLDGQGAVHLYHADFDTTLPEKLLKAYEKTSGGYSQEEREAIEAFLTDGVERQHRMQLPTPVYAVAYSPDGRKVAAGTGQGEIVVWDTMSGEELYRFGVAPRIEPEPVSTMPTVARSPLPRAKTTPEREAGVLLDGHPISQLLVHPETLEAVRPNDTTQFLVTAVLDNGETRDMTRAARYLVSDGLGKVSDTGRFVPRKEGVGRLELTVADSKVEIPLNLETFVERHQADFIRDVNPLLTKLGCNGGPCHGANEGKNGFKLSLRGYDPLFDLRALADDLAARRVNSASPDESLLLLKATGAVPHEGGQRTTPDSESYAILRQWIAEGASVDLTVPRVERLEMFPINPIVQQVGTRQQMRIVATYTDGSRRDVTAWAFVESGNMDVAQADEQGLVTTLRRGEAPILARYEGAYAATTLTVMGDREGFVWDPPPVNNRIDELVAAKWERMKLLPSELCSDAEFFRRVSLDLTGLPPSPEQVRAFLDNPRDSRSKRDALIERLLGSNEFVDHWANRWADLLQVNRKFLGEEGARLFRNWIQEQVAANVPYDQFVRSILTANGSNKDNPAAAYWKILRDPTEAMENTTHLFLATRFNCNKCHDHPFERWTQDQYFSLAQYFAQVDFAKDEASGDRRVGGSAVEGERPLFEIVSDKKEGAVNHERTGEPVAPVVPYTVESWEARADQPLRGQLADWLTAADNRYFAMSYVNRLWGYLLGVGLIEPLDDIRAGNPPSNPELLDHLTREFVESGFNAKHVLRQICQSRTYQLAVTRHQWNEDDSINFSRALPRRLPAEVLLDSVYAVTGATPQFPGAKPGLRAAQLVDSAVDVPSGFLANLGRPVRESACECERSNDIQLSSVMSLLSGPAVSDAVQDPENALVRLVNEHVDNRELTSALFLRVLNRPATPAELNSVQDYMRALDEEHDRLKQSLNAAERAWDERKTTLEQERERAIGQTEQALQDYMIQRAPELAASQRKRLETIARAEAEVHAYEPFLDPHLEDWEQSLSADHRSVSWVPLDVRNVSATGSARLRRLPDGSVLSTPSVGELPNYTVVGETKLPGITGIKIEALPHESLPRFGPGHAEGDFVISELTLEHAPLAEPEKFARLRIVGGGTDMQMEGRSLEQLWNGRAEQGHPEGWSAGKETGRPHWAAFAIESPAGDADGSRIRITLQHRYEAPFEIGRFRIWVTANENPTREGLPSEIAEIVRVPTLRRSEAQKAKLLAHVRMLNPGMLERDFTLALAREPLPEDTRLRELERALVRVSRPVLTDPALVQLRQDYRLSELQLKNRRLTAAQDLTWALINTSSFLFNH